MKKQLVNRSILPRLIRFRDAPFYLGMDKNRFNTEVRPHLSEIRIGIQGIAFDRLDLDAWVDHYIARNECPTSKLRGVGLWDKSEAQACETEKGSGTSINRSTDKRFEKALAQAISKRRS